MREPEPSLPACCPRPRLLAPALVSDEIPAQTPSPSPSSLGPDPVVGAGLALTGMAVMGLAGGLDAHWPFLAGALVAVAGAVLFVACVGLSAWKQRGLGKPGTQEGSRA